MTTDDWERLQQGQEVVIDGKVWTLCADCGRVVRRKLLFGTAHFCAAEYERERRTR